DQEQPAVKRSKEEQSDTSPLCFQSPATLFESLIQPMGTDRFFSEYWEKKPLHLQRSDPGTASYYQSLFQLCDLQSLCSQGLEYYRDINVVRCVNGKKKLLNKEGRVKHSVLNKIMSQNKATVQYHQPQRFKVREAGVLLWALVGSNIYITPEESQGLPPHYDDVEKHWRLYNPTVPLAAEYSVQSETVLAGDLLYFPRGTIHQARTPAGVNCSIHLTLNGFDDDCFCRAQTKLSHTVSLSPPAVRSWGDLLLDVFPSLLCGRSRREVSLREGMARRLLLVITTSSSAGLHTNQRLAASLRALADEMETGAQDLGFTHMKRDFIMNRLPPYCQQQLSSPSGKSPALEDTVILTFKDHVVITVEPRPQSTDDATELVVFVLHSLKNQREGHMMGDSCDDQEERSISTGLQFPLSYLQALRQLQLAEQLVVAQLQLPTQEDKLNLALALWSENLLRVL
uniref:Bifunctional lysine-specific demethylase and histidyl-hydroxylase n=1 Tax=Maylandia zebra TaxID=106582 RepID=A0A3P9D9Y4_9CICH